MHTGRTLSIAAITVGITALSLRASGSSFNGNSSIAGFHAPGDNIGGDGHAHIFVARNGTEIDEIYSYNYSGGYDNRFQSNPIWTAAWPVDDIGALYADPASGGDGYIHVIVHQENGDLNDIYYRPAQGINGRTIATYTDVQAMDAFWSKANQYMHIVYADSSNRVWDMRLRPNQSPIVFGPIFSAPAAVYDIGAYDGPDSFMHAHALLSNGDVWEIYFNTTNAYSDLIQNFGGGWTSIASMSCTDHPPPGYVTFCNPNDYNEFYPANGPYIDSYWYGNGSHYMNILDPPWQPSPAAISVAAVLNYGLANVNSGYKALFVAADDNTVYELSFAAGVDGVATVPTKSTVWSYN